MQHLLEAVNPAQGTALVEQLTQVVNLLAQGSAPADLAEHLAGAKLIALKKPKGGIRPIAIGEILRRLVGKCLCAAIKDDAAAYFEPRQVGVACKLGVDAAVHTCRSWSEHHRGNRRKALLKIDFSNAFNCVDRGTVLARTLATFPGIARWANWCYAKPSRLVFGS